MIHIKQQLSKKEKKEIFCLLQILPDIFGDFYITKKLTRLHLKENFSILLESLKYGDYIIFDLENKGVAIVIGFAEKKTKIFNAETGKEKVIDSRHYIRVIAKDNKTVSDLLTIIDWNFCNLDLWAKLNKKNPIVKVFYQNNFKFAHGRGNELLLIKEKNPKKWKEIHTKQDKE